MLLNPAASQAVCPTPGIPALTSKAGVSLSFVFLTPPATSRRLPRACSWSSWSQSAVSRVPSASPPAPPCRWPVSRPRARSRSSQTQSGSSEHTGVPEFREMLGGTRSRLTVSVCSLTGASLQVRPLPRAGGYRFPSPEHGGSLPLPFIFRYLCAVSRLPTSYLNTQRWRFSFVEIQMYLPASQADSKDVQAGLVPIELNSGDRLEKGSPTPPPS